MSDYTDEQVKRMLEKSAELNAHSENRLMEIIKDYQQKLAIAVEALEELASDNFKYSYMTFDDFGEAKRIDLIGGLIVANEALAKIRGMK